METNRTRQLKNLAASFPTANQQTANQLEAARQIQLQGAIGQTPAQGGISQIAPVAQQVGVQQAAQAGAQQVQAAQQATNQATQLGQLALQEKGRELQGQEATRQLGAQRQAQQIDLSLAQLNAKLKNQLIDQQMQFKRDEAGRALLNEQQLVDYAVINSKNDIELAKYQQLAEQAWQKKLYMMQTAQKKIETVLNQGYLKEGQALDQAQKQQLAAAKNALEQKIKRDQARAQNKMAMWQTAGTIVGGAIGAFGGPAGATAGATIGGAIGGAAGSQVGK